MIPGFDYSAFLEKNLIAIFLIYGCSFLYLFLSILLSFRPLRAIGLSAAFGYLMLFALTHGAVEWMDMYLQYARLVHDRGADTRFYYLRLALLASSFLFMLAFGLKLSRDIEQMSKNTCRFFIGYAAILFFLVVPAYLWKGTPELKELEILFRSLLGFPAAAIAGMGLYKLSRNSYYENVLPEGFGKYFRRCGYTLIAYSVLAGIIVPKGQILLSPYINQELFFSLTGAPIQLFRATAAFLISYFLIRALALRMAQRLLGVLSAFFVMFFILAFTGYISINLIGKSYEKAVRLSVEQRDIAYLSRTVNRLYDASLNPALSAGKPSDNPVAEIYLRELGAAIGEIRAMHRNADMAEEGVDEAWEMATIDRIALIIERQAGRRGSLNADEIDEIRTHIGSLVVTHQTKIDSRRETMAEDINNFTTLRIVLFLLSVAAFAFIGYTFHRILIKPLHILQTGAAQIAEGQLEHRIRIGTADELQELAVNFNMMADSLLDRTRRLENEVITDALTGLYNRKHFHLRLELEINRALRAHSPISILLIEVDDFKQYNDRYGHPKGDEVLRKCAAALCENVRRMDLATRYGGEEFAVILAETDKQGAQVVAENIRRTIERQPFCGEREDAAHHITVSIGIAAFPADTKKMKDLMKMAGDALHAAKQAGKNRVCAHGD